MHKDSDTSLHFLAASKQMRITLFCKDIVKRHPCALHLFPMDPGVAAQSHSFVAESRAPLSLIYFPSMNACVYA